MALRKFVHPVAGSTTVLSDGTVLTFAGPRGGQGSIVLDEDAPDSSLAIAQLSSMCKKNVVGMYEEVGGAESATIIIDPSAVAAQQDVLQSAARAQTSGAVADAVETQLARGQEVGPIGNLEGGPIQTMPDANMSPEAKAALERLNNKR